LAPARQEFKPLTITNDENEFAVAVREPKLSQLTEDDLKKVLRYVYSLVGIRAQNIPASPEKEFLHAYIFKHYGGHTASEIRLAFDMAIQGQLDLDAKEVRCYENFSVAYFATIMRAYRSWATEQARRLDRVTEPAPPTAEQLLDIRIGYAFYLFNQVNKLPAKR
jgi:hypothetical protein